jgi:transposase-like protein
MLKRLSKEIKRCIHVIRILPNEESALRFIRLAVEIYEDWIEADRHLKMEMLRERKELELLEAA